MKSWFNSYNVWFIKSFDCFIDLTGGQDGSVQLWEWSHAPAVASPRPPGTYAKVTRVKFSQHGNKFGVADGDGNLSLWLLILNTTSSTRPFFVSGVQTRPYFVCRPCPYLCLSHAALTSSHTLSHRLDLSSKTWNTFTIVNTLMDRGPVWHHQSSTALWRNG